MPTCWIIAGPNGAGKTNFVLRYLPILPGCRRFVNADLTAAGLSPLPQVFPPRVDSVPCFMNAGAEPELVFEQQGIERSIFHPQWFAHLLKESE